MARRVKRAPRPGSKLALAYDMAVAAIKEVGPMAVRQTLAAIGEETNGRDSTATRMTSALQRAVRRGILVSDGRRPAVYSVATATRAATATVRMQQSPAPPPPSSAIPAPIADSAVIQVAIALSSAAALLSQATSLVDAMMRRGAK